MTDQATRVVPAGWYQDPALSEQVRWWNGLAWTEHVRDKPTVTPAPASVAPVVVTATSTSTLGSSNVTQTSTQTTEERIAASRELERQFGISTSENDIITSATALGYGLGSRSDASAAARDAESSRDATVTPINPAAREAAAAAAARQGARGRVGGHATARTATGAAWLVALTPVLTFGTAVASAYVYLYVSQNPLVFLAFLLPYLLGFLWALSDGRTLASRGFDAPHPAWALLGALCYLIVRRLRVAGNGALVMFLVVGALVIGLPVAAYATGALKPLSHALTIQNTISADYVGSGRATSVNCPPFVDASTAGTLYTCDATLGNGVVKPVWVSIDGDNGQFSYAMGL